eukprot:gnl/MRDRNA2_/MRDRNA2_126811_c0_seq1.p1 gnl/MRDRNA2_/MRDRNA2_126811_c0~~gnl/MRDRNA2_/MRDRNA2_126811_c0_seq1.p1  ORF type:complete len:635 (-),score=164.80 gnl/MRDRNA2_/MRDRNA2_126811_c0_seq1:86-1990(-)
MRSAFEFILFGILAQVYAQDSFDEFADRFVNKIMDRALNAWPVHEADLQNSTLGKPGALAIQSQKSLPTHRATAPRAQMQPFPALRSPMQNFNAKYNAQSMKDFYANEVWPSNDYHVWTPQSWQASAKREVRTQATTFDFSSKEYDYDLVIIGCGVGGHGAALHAVKQGMKTAIIEGADIGGTCVNRGCVPSKALLAAAGRIRELQDKKHMSALGIDPGPVGYDREKVANHANQLASTIAGNLERSLVALGVDILIGHGSITAPHQVKYGPPGDDAAAKTVSAKEIIISTGSVPFVPRGIEVDGKTVFTSDEALKLDWVPDWVGIIGSGYIGLEFSDVYTALGSEVSFIEAIDKLMPGFDREIARLAERMLIKPRKIEYYTGVFATKVTPGIPGEKPVTVELTDAKTKEVVSTLNPDAVLVATGRAPFTEGLGLEKVNVEPVRGFVPCDEKMRVTDKDGNLVEGLWCIGDANGKMMLAHAASAQGISAVENMCDRDNVLNHNSVPAACFTHPEVAFVGLTQEQAEEKAKEEGFEVGVSKTAFKGNSKALAELESDGMAKCIYRKDTGEILGFWIIGIHAADLIHEASNAIAQGLGVQELKFYVHAHPTLAEVVDEVFKGTALAGEPEPIAGGHR